MLHNKFRVIGKKSRQKSEVKIECCLPFGSDLQYHNQQIWKVVDCANKLDDFLKSAEGIDAQYQQLAFAECCAVLGKHMQRQN